VIPSGSHGSEVAELRRVRDKLANIPGATVILEALFALAPVGIQIYDAGGRSLLTNQAFRDLFGSEPPPEYNILRDEIAAANGLLGLVQRAFAGEVITAPPLWYDPRDLTQVEVTEGRRVAIEATFFPLRDAEGAVQNVGIVFKDVTAEMDNARLYQDGREAIRIRDEFLSVAGHELKTPLTALQLYLERLGNTLGSLAPDQDQDRQLARGLADVHRVVNRFGGLIDQLLDVSRLSAGRLVLDPERVDLAEIVREAVTQVAEEALRRQTPIRVTTRDAVVGYWDRARLNQVLSNLLSNAVKYGAGQPVLVDLQAEGADGVVVVRDHGIGIAPENQLRIFEKFERAAPERQFGGLGLGLWICREIVTAMKGSLDVSSAPGAGATFTVRLPRG
jgi:signal transduction histidine kinase